MNNIDDDIMFDIEKAKSKEKQKDYNKIYN